MKAIDSIVSLAKREPLRIVAIVQAFLGLLLVFGVALSAAQVGAIITFISVVLGIGIRKAVTPNAKLQDGKLTGLK